MLLFILITFNLILILIHNSNSNKKSNKLLSSAASLRVPPLLLRVAGVCQLVKNECWSDSFTACLKVKNNKMNHLEGIFGQILIKMSIAARNLRLGTKLASVFKRKGHPIDKPLN